jgi:hypothetical protein
MAVISSLDAARTLDIEGGLNAQRSVLINRGFGFGIAATSGTIAAAIAANATTFAMRLSLGSTRKAFIERIRLEFVTIVAFTTPVTAGRRLSIFRGAGAAATGGTSLSGAGAINPKHGSADTSQFSTANGGDIRIATTGALTTTGITFEPVPLAEMGLVHVGNAGNYREVTFEYGGAKATPIQLDAGQLIAVRNPAAFDAAGTWQLTTVVDWYEGSVLDSI